MNKLPEASSTKAGIVTTSTQSFAGNKTIIGNLNVSSANSHIRLSGATTDAVIQVSTSTLVLGDWSTGGGKGLSVNLTNGTTTVQSAASTILNITSGTGITAPQLYFNRTSGTSDALMATAGANDQLVAGSLAGDLIIGVISGARRILFTPDYGSTISGIMDGTGSWTFGQVGFTGQHEFRSRKLRLRPDAGTQDVEIVFGAAHATTNRARIYSTGSSGDSNGDLRFETGMVGSPLLMATASSAGSWSFGVAGTATDHIFYGVLAANRGGTSTNPAMHIVKGLNSTATTNRLIDFGINGAEANSGYIGANGANAAAFQSTSDGRLKTNIQSYTGGLDKISSLNPVMFEWEQYPGSLCIGFVAQEVELVIPDAVTAPTDEDGYYSMCRENFIPYLVSAIKELKAQVDALQAQIDGY